MKRYINFENIIKGFIVGIIVGFIMQACVLHAGTDQSVFKKYKIVNEEQKQVSVEIVDKYCKEAHTTMMYNVSTHTYIPLTTPSKYYITCKYNDKEYDIKGEETYNKFKDKVGEKATGELKIVTYGDGTVRQEIISIK